MYYVLVWFSYVFDLQVNIECTLSYSLVGAVQCSATCVAAAAAALLDT